jgi:hypothetical protein
LVLKAVKDITINIIFTVPDADNTLGTVCLFTKHMELNSAKMVWAIYALHHKPVLSVMAVAEEIGYTYPLTL